MHASSATSTTSYSDLPTLCIPTICQQLGSSGPAPIVRVRTVNQDFHDHSRSALAGAILQQLKAVHYQSIPSSTERLRQFRHYLRTTAKKEYLPAHLRHGIFVELCRIVSSLANSDFHSGWRDMVAAFNSESGEMRAQLQAAMDQSAGRVQMYGDGGVAFTFKTPAW